MTDDFKARLLAHARTAVDRSQRAATEAATAQYLVLPFFQLLGYDPLDPDEVVPEAHASFSDKFKNRVDYAICQAGKPVIGVEVKKVGALAGAHRGELKGYFNAVQTIKLGILTDGLVWQLYTDTGSENMMDDEPFVLIDLAQVADGILSDAQFDALVRLRKTVFDPADVGAHARRKLYVAGYLSVLEEAFREPSEALVRTLMDLAKVDGRRTTKLVEEHAQVLREAMAAFLDRKILERVGFAAREDLVKMPPVVIPPGATIPASVTAGATQAAAVGAAVGASGETPAEGGSVGAESGGGGGSGAGIVTTDTEVMVFEHVRRRLPFLIDRDETLYSKLEHLYPRDFKTRFTICYKQDRNGRLFNFMEMTQGPRYRFEFPDSGAVINTDDLYDIDQELLGTFMKRVAELG